MTPVAIAPERWRDVTEAFDAACLLQREDRQTFVERECDAEVGPALLQLLEWNDLAGDFLEDPIVRIVPDDADPPAPVFATGTLVADRFRIVRLIGRGGMGEVYEAEDTVLGEPVALKAMRTDVRQRVDASRFLTEAQLARRVSHAGVCRVHDVALQRLPDGREVLVITMELLGGETLSTRLGQGRLPVDEALRLTRLLAEALDAAHARGVVHGDIKPGNVQLVPDPSAQVRPVLTDFGLASAVGDVRPGAAGLAGTPRYMAPEQLCGQAPGWASDLYSFAVLVHELLAGTRPAQEGAGGALAAAPASALPARWRRALRRGLHADPAARFDSAAGMVRAITGESLWHQRVRRHLRVHARAWSAVAFGVALIGGPIRLYWQARPSIAPASLVLMTGVRNHTAEPALSGATEILRSQLVQSTQFDVMGTERIADVLRQMRREPNAELDPVTAREVAMRTGAPLVVRSAIDPDGTGYAVSVTLERVGPRPKLARATWQKRFPAPSREALFNAFHDSALWIRDMVGEPAADLRTQDRASSETTTSSWQALQLFDQANRLNTSGRTNEAVLLLRQALQADPDFAMANARLADLLIGLKRDQEGFGAWQRAVAGLEETQLTSREHLRIRGQYLEDTGDLQSAEIAYRTYALHYPSDPDAAFFLGSVLADLGRTREAVPSLELASRLRPASAVPVVHLARAFIELGDPPAVDRQVDRLRQMGANDWARWIEALRSWVANDPNQARMSLESLRQVADDTWQSRLYTIRASWQAETGGWPEARTELEAGIRFDQAHGLIDREADKWIHLAEISRREGRPRESIQSIDRALALAPSARRLQLGGTVLVRVGATREAEALLARLRAEPALPKNTMRVARLEAEIELARAGSVADLSTLVTVLSGDRIQEDRTLMARAMLASGDRDGARQLLQDVLAHPARLYAGPEPALPAPRSEAIGLLAASTSPGNR